MSPDQAKTAAAVMVAWAEGRAIESKQIHHTTWHDCGSPTWDWFLCDFRIKPNPREWWLVEWVESGRGGDRPNTEFYRLHADACDSQKALRFRGLKAAVVHVREVIDDKC